MTLLDRFPSLAPVGRALGLSVALAIVFGGAPSSVTAQPTCNICYTYTGPPGGYFGHAFHPYVTPLPPQLTTWVSTEVLQSESLYPEDPSHQGHTYWITGKCSDYHDPCYPEGSLALTTYINTGSLTLLAQLASEDPGRVWVHPSENKILIRCDSEAIPAEYPLNWLDWARLSAMTADR